MANLSLVLNNSRFLIFPEVRIPHLASHVLGNWRGGRRMTGNNIGDFVRCCWRPLSIHASIGEPAIRPLAGNCWERLPGAAWRDQVKRMPARRAWCSSSRWPAIFAKQCATTLRAQRGWHETTLLLAEMLSIRGWMTQDSRPIRSARC